jgi:hypothetical protein
MYSSSDGALKPKTFYNSKKSIGGQVMNLLKKSQPYTSGTRTRPIDTLKPEVLFIINSRFSKNKSRINFSNKQEKTEKNITKATPSAALKQAIDSVDNTQ